MKLVIGSDHGGIHLKEVLKQHLAERGIEVSDAGTYTEESCDYPDIAVKVCREITDGNAERGFSAIMSREHNNANVICLGERVLGPGLAVCILDAWLDTEFAGGRHERRVNKIMAVEE